MALAIPATAYAQQRTTTDLTEFSLEELLNLHVTSVSKTERDILKTGAAIFLLTSEDIRRSGATSIPDLLRLAPGVDVAQIDANAWAISIRGFNNRLANKVLVLIDGRSVYTPVTSGVYWDQQDVVLEDIERIEVIRGPGGTVWGANAVNGVINIITKRTDATQGVLVRAGGGSQEHAQVSARYGAAVGSTGTYRLFGNYSNSGNMTASAGGEAADASHVLHGGFRSDWALSPGDTVTVQGDLLETDGSQTLSMVFSNALPFQRTFDDPVSSVAGNMLARWNHTLSNGSETSLQAYYDRYTRHEEGISEGLSTFDVDFHHHVTLGSRHDAVWGAGYRVTSDELHPGYRKGFVPERRTNSLFNAFVQDEITLSRSLWLTVGTKVEHNAYTGAEYQPGAQLVWQPTSRQAVWMSGARAIRQPSRVDSGLRLDLLTFPLPGGGFALVTGNGTPNPKAEQLNGLEVGYRTQVKRNLSVDVATFSNFYRQMQVPVPLPPFFSTTPSPPHLVLPNTFSYKSRVQTRGVEAFAHWHVHPRWRLSPGYSIIRTNLDIDPVSVNFTGPEMAANTPEHQSQLRSSLNVTRNIDWDATHFYVGSLRNAGNGAVPGYHRVDTQVTWRVGSHAEVSVVGQHLLRPVHPEFHDAYALVRTLIERRVFAKITLHSR